LDKLVEDAAANILAELLDIWDYVI
jgi:hypothetical protein